MILSGGSDFCGGEGKVGAKGYDLENLENNHFKVQKCSFLLETWTDYFLLALSLAGNRRFRIKMCEFGDGFLLTTFANSCILS